MDAKKAAAAFPALEARIRGVLIDHEYGLFATGAPADEHDRDVHAIVSRLQHVADESEVAAMLADVSGEWMDSGSKVGMALCKSMAPAVWQAWREFKAAAG